MSPAAISTLVVISIACIILLTSKWKLNAFIALFLVSLLLAIVVLPSKDVVSIMMNGFGNTMASAGFLIILGAIIAIILDKTGAAITLARYILSKTGEKNGALALGITGFVAGMTIFCDSGFIILSGLAKSFSAKTKTAMPFIAGVLACSLYVVHNLIPTHPGALVAAGILNANIGDLVVAGILFAIPGFFVAYLWVKQMTKNKNYLPAPAHEISIDEVEKNHPSVLSSFLPVVVPLVLIATGSLLHILQFKANVITNIFEFCGQPVIALVIGVLFALFLLHDKKMETLNDVFETAIEKAGPILIITAAGGMFGLIIKETGVGTFAGTALSKTGLGLLIPFGIALILKTAQGSSTVAIITAASIVAPMLPSLGLASETGKLFTMLSMGAGSMIISHANDSYFWVVTKFSDLHANVTLRVFSTATAVMGITVFLCVWITSHFFL
ncbi:MAG TPA: GntP family permease [Hanamia sp.]|jgi:GntP family gluconate:H+ symporter|nr:GntP family permease [Hanamia sp.]